MQDHEKRLIVEAVDVRSRVGRLEDFLASSRVDGLDALDVTLLECQLCSMQGYLRVLDLRIERIAR